jgi:Flp pilus assembly protein TadD
VQELIYRKWIPFDILFQVDHRSPLYNEKDRAGLFYSESWALTHMLYLAEEFRPRFGDFVSQISAGASTEQAVQKVYGKTPADLQQDLDRYLRGNRIMVAIFDIRLTASAEKPSVVPATPFESGMMLATLAMHTSRAKTAELELEKLAQDHPDRFEPLQALGYLRWRDNNHEQARELFGKAFDLGAASPKLLWDYARLEASAAGTAERVARILEKVLEAEPGNLEARLMLGQQHIRRERYGQALASLRQIRRVKPEQAYRLFYALAFSAARLEEWEAAERDAERAVQHGKTPAEKQAAERLLKYLQSRREPVAAAAIQESQPRLQRDATTSEPTPPDTIEAVPVKRLTLPVQGKFVHLECLGDVARMRIEGPEGKTLQLLMRDPGRIAITGTGAATIDLTCGPQPGKHVKVEYDPGDDQKHATVGEVVAIEFR